MGIINRKIPVRTIVANVVVAFVVCLGMLLYVTGRMTPSHRFPAVWQAMVAQQTPAAKLVSGWFAPGQPPEWVRDLAVTWQLANPINWWWLPLVFFALHWVVSRWIRGKRERDRNRRY